MAFADGIVITVNAVPLTFNRIQSPGNNVYQTADGLWKLTISHQLTKDKIRSVARLDQMKVAADPISTLNDTVTASDYIVQERSRFGFSNTEIKNMRSGFSTWHVLAATQDKILAQES